MRGFCIFSVITTGIFVCISCDEPKEKDTIPPVVTIISPKNYATISDTVTIKCSVVDDSEIKYVKILINDQYTSLFDTIAPFNFLWDTQPYSDSSESSIQAIAKDIEGNVGESIRHIIYMDTTVPQTPKFIKYFALDNYRYNSGLSILPAFDGGLICGVRSVYSSSISEDWIFKTSDKGDILWSNFPSSTGRIIQIIPTNDNNYICLQSGSTTASLTKLNIYGAELWSTSTYVYESEAEYFIQNDDNQYVIVGTSRSHCEGWPNVWLLTANENGGGYSSRVLTCEGEDDVHSWDYGKCINRSNDGGYIISGFSDHSGILLIKLDVNYNQEWMRYYGGEPNQNRTYNRVFVNATNDGYIIYGAYNSTIEPTGSQYDFVLIKTDLDGNEIWRRGYLIEDNIYPTDVIHFDIDNNYVIVFEKIVEHMVDDDIVLRKFDQAGNMIWNQVYENGIGRIYTRRINSIPDGIIITGQFSTIDSDSSKVFIQQINQNGDLIPFE